MSRFTEGRKANILKMLSQLHAYLARYDDLDKAETHFKQRMEDAGCLDIYAVIDEVLDVVDTAKHSEKAKLLNKIYKTYFPKSAKDEPATDEEIESAMDTHHLDGVGEKAIEGDASEASDTEEDKDNGEDEVTLGDIRKSEEDYVVAAANNDNDDTDEDERKDKDEIEEDNGSDDDKLDEGLYNLANRSRILNYMKNSSIMSDDELEELYNNAIRPKYKTTDYNNINKPRRAVVTVGDGEIDEDEFFERTIKQARFYSKKIRESIEDDAEDADSDDIVFDDHHERDFRDDNIDLVNKRDNNDIEDATFEDNEDFDEFDPMVDSEESLAAFPEPSQATMGDYPVGYSQSLQDAAEELITDLIASGVEDDEDLIEAIIQEFSDPEHPMEYGMASDILENYYEMNDPANEDVTEGDLEQEYDDMLMDGWSSSEILQKLSKKYGLTRHEIEMSIGGIPDIDQDAFDESYYSSTKTSKMTEGTMPGPGDQGGASTPPPHTRPSNSISAPDTTKTDTSTSNTTSTDTSQQNQSPDPKQIIQQNPDVPDFFSAMAKMKPEEIQSLAKMFTENTEESDRGDVSDLPAPGEDYAIALLVKTILQKGLGSPEDIFYNILDCDDSEIQDLYAILSDPEAVIDRVLDSPTLREALLKILTEVRTLMVERRHTFNFDLPD